MLKFLTKKVLLSEVPKLLEGTRISTANYCIVYGCYGYDAKKFRRALTVNGKKIQQIRTVERVEREIKRTGKTKEELLKLRNEKPLTDIQKSKEKINNAVNKAVSKLKGSLDILNVNTKEVQAIINSASSEIIDEAMLTEIYSKLYHLLMATAMGEIPTRKSTIAYEVEEDDVTGEVIKKGLAKKPNGKSIMYEELSTVLPNGKAFGEAMVVLEVIHTITGNNKSILTEDERDERVKGYLLETKKEMLSLKNTSQGYAPLSNVEEIEI